VKQKDREKKREREKKVGNKSFVLKFAGQGGAMTAILILFLKRLNNKEREIERERESRKEGN
jgi:hypothetical protein